MFHLNVQEDNDDV